MIRIKQPKFYEKETVVIMTCPTCNLLKIVEKQDIEFTYLEINKFRKEHEHITKRK
jgi:hypothetical protein